MVKTTHPKTPSVTCHYEKVNNEMVLPGSGEKPVNCAGYIPTEFCPNCGRVHLSKGNCRKPTCPDCSTTWRYDRVKKILERTVSYKMENEKRSRHFVLSPSKEQVENIENSEDIFGKWETVVSKNGNPYRKLQEPGLVHWAYDIAKEKGVDAGLIIFHPYRIKPEKKQELREIARKEYDWKAGEFHLWKVLVELEDWEDFVYFYPHFHIEAFADKGDRFEPGKPEDDYIWEGIQEVSSPKGIMKLSMYLLSHAGVSEELSFQSIRWFGELSPSKWSIEDAEPKIQFLVEDKIKRLVGKFAEDTEDLEYMTCAECGTKLVSISKAPDYWNNDNFDEETKKILQNSFWIYEGVIPPPKKGISEIEARKYLLEADKSDKSSLKAEGVRR